MAFVNQRNQFCGAPLFEIPSLTDHLVSFHSKFARIFEPFNAQENKLINIINRVCTVAMGLFAYPLLFTLAFLGAVTCKNKVNLEKSSISYCLPCEKKWKHHLPVSFENKVAIVTGGANGIGKEIVSTLASLGAIVVIADLDEKNGKKLASEISEKGQKVQFLKTNLTIEEECQTTINSTIKNYGRLDVLVNNAGTNDKVSIHDSLDHFQNSLKRNLYHYVAMSKFAWNYLKETQGNIVLIGSKVAFTGQGGTVGYAASKGAILGLTRELALEGCRDGIRVNTVIPAEVSTEQYMSWINSFENPSEKLHQICKTIPFQKRMTTAQEIANTVVFIASDLSSHTTGQELFVDGGYTHLDRSYGILS